MKERLAKRVNVKSIVTITLTVIFCVLTLNHTVSGEQFMTVFTTVIAFYFGTQHQKNCDECSKITEERKE